MSYDAGDNGFKIQEFVAHSTQVNCISIGQKSNQVLATGGEDHKVNIWNIGDVSRNIWTLGQNKSPIESLCFDAEEQNVVSGALNGSIKVFDMNEGRLARNLGGHQVNVCCLQYHPYGEFVASGSVDCTMKVWDVRNKSCIQTYTGHTKEITCVRFSPDGKWVASSSKDGKLLLWDLVAGKLVNSLIVQPSYVTRFEFNPTVFSMATVTSARNVKLWDLETMEVTHCTIPESSPVRAIAYSNLGSALCTTSKDSLRIWDLEGTTLNMKGTVDAGWDRISEMNFSNNTNLIAGSFISNFVSLWALDLEEYLSNEIEDDEDGEGERESGRADNEVGIGISSGGDVNDAPPPYRFDHHDDYAAGEGGRNGRSVSGKGPSRVSDPMLAPAARPTSSSSDKLQRRPSAKDVMDPVREPIPSPVSPSSSSAGGVVPGAAAGRPLRRQNSGSSRQQLSRVEQQLSQLQMELGLPDMPAKRRTSLSPRDGQGQGQSAAGAAGGRSRDRLTRDDQDEGGKLLGLDQMDEIIAEAKSPSIGGADPAVIWEPESSPKEMANSMGESFWRRFKDGNGDQQRGRDGGPADVKRPSSIEELLPSSAYDNDNDDNTEGIDDENISARGYTTGRYNARSGYDDAPPQPQQQSDSSGHRRRDGSGSRALGVDEKNAGGGVQGSSRAGGRAAGRGVEIDHIEGTGTTSDDKQYIPTLLQQRQQQPIPQRNLLSAIPSSGVQQQQQQSSFVEAPHQNHQALPPSAAIRAATAQREGREKRVSTLASAAASSEDTADGDGLAVVGIRHSQQQGGNRRMGSAGLAPGFNPSTNNSDPVAVVAPPRRAGPSFAPRPTSSSSSSSSSSVAGGGGDGAIRIPDRERIDASLERLHSQASAQTSVLSQRLTSLRVLRQLWNKGEVADTLEHLLSLSDSMQHNPQNLVVLADFIEVIDLRASGLSLDNAVKILKIIDEMISMSEGWKSEHIVRVTFAALTDLGEAFGELIQQTRSIIFAGGVDLSREERLNKCNACYFVLVKAKNRTEQLKNLFRNSRDVLSAIEGYLRIAGRYFS